MLQCGNEEIPSKSGKVGVLSNRRIYLAVDLGATKTAVSVWQVDAGTDPAAPQRVARKRWETLSHGPVPNLELIVRESRTLVAGLDDPASVDAIGISAGGPVDSRTGTVLSIPNLSGWDLSLIHI